MTLDDRLSALKKLSTDEFSQSCIEGARRVLEDTINPLRLNFLATAMRTLFEHMMETLAPVDEVARCAWFKPEQPTGKPTRGQRIVYAIQGGLSEAFVATELQVDLAPLRKRLLTAVDECAKRIHGRDYNAIVDPAEQDAVATSIVSAFVDLLDTVRLSRKAVLEPIVEALDDVALDALMYETIVEVDELATHYYLQNVSVGRTEVHVIGPTSITYRSRGSVEVILQFGSNSDIRNDMGAQLELSFPFTCDIEVPLSEPWNLEIAETRYFVDVSKWRDAMGPDDEGP